MAEYLNMHTLRFQLYDVHDMPALFTHRRFQDFDRDSMDMLLDTVKDFSDEVLYPCFREMDAQPATYQNGRITVHPVIGTVMEKYAEFGMIGMGFDERDGGMQLPGMAYQATSFIIDAANNNISGYGGLTAGAANLIVTFGSEALKQAFVPRMLAGEWAGTMCLTEPQAGSSLSDVTTTAYPRPDGGYDIRGQKIFISGGDHQCSENIVHLLLARIDGAPPGTRGISLFVVPRMREADGALQDNDVVTTADYQKLGQRGYCTAHLSFGENDNCRGWLVGKPHHGLKYMFQMMNEARIAVGRGAVAIAAAAYHASLAYAHERPQGRRIMDSGKKDLSRGQTLIINHPDVRRMLLLQKAIYEGALSVIFQATRYHDMVTVSEGEEREKYHLLLELLTPVAKTYPSEMGQVAVNNGLQVLGGYGFCSEFILQQYLRDIRIYAIYEGTTGIQSLDLLGRKVPLEDGRAMALLAGEMQETIAGAMAMADLKPMAENLAGRMKLLERVLGHLMPIAARGDHEQFLADATPFMEFFGVIVVGWQWLKMGIAARTALDSGAAPFSTDFYESKLHTMKFYYKYEMPRTTGLAELLMNPAVLTVAEEKELII